MVEEEVEGSLVIDIGAGVEMRRGCPKLFVVGIEVEFEIRRVV
jgi:hypothetical protein